MGQDIFSSGVTDPPAQDCATRIIKNRATNVDRQV